MFKETDNLLIIIFCIDGAFELDYMKTNNRETNDKYLPSKGRHSWLLQNQLWLTEVEFVLPGVNSFSLSELTRNRLRTS